MIKFDHISKSYTDEIALNDVSFHINRGEFVFFTGASGAGKSTIIKLLLHDFAPTDGTIYVDDEDINLYSHSDIALYRRKLGIVFQDYKLLPYKNSFENVAFAAEVIGASDDADTEDKIMQALKVVGMDSPRKLSALPSELSGGEQQRVAIARAIVNRPKIIIADEPTGNLDDDNSRNIMQLFEKINKQYGTTIIMATHDKGLIEEFPKRVIQLHNGIVVRDYIFDKAVAI